MTKIFSMHIFAMLIGIIIILLAYTAQSHETSGDRMKEESHKEDAHVFTIYAQAHCVYCERAIEFFRTKQLNFKKIDITPDQWAKLKNETGSHTVPYIFIDEKYVGGCSDLLALDSSGELDKMLK